tara:strand:+ start:103 stop:414 length:312 start_codon:yes stop_codon:yes gene_type:complete
MGHFLFIILHTMAVIFGIVGLIVTIPLHLIYSAVKKPNDDKARDELLASVNKMKSSRPKAVRQGKRMMTFDEGWAEIKAYPGVYFQAVGTIVIVGTVLYLFMS